MPQSDPCSALGEVRLKIEKDGGLVIPAVFRGALGIKAGDEILLRWEDHELCITKKLRDERTNCTARRRARR